MKKEKGTCSNSNEIKEPISPVKEIKKPINPKNTIVQTLEEVNMVNKVKYIIFPTLIKLKNHRIKSRCNVRYWSQ